MIGRSSLPNLKAYSEMLDLCASHGLSIANFFFKKTKDSSKHCGPKFNDRFGDYIIRLVAKCVGH